MTTSSQCEIAGGPAGSGDAKSLGAADFLSLAAAPAFAIMAVLTGIPGGARPDVICSAMQDASPLSGMAPMYLLMSAFHSAPWFRWALRRRGRPFRR